MIKTACTKCGKICNTPKHEVTKSFRSAKRRLSWWFACKCGTRTPIDTSEVRKDLK